MLSNMLKPATPSEIKTVIRSLMFASSIAAGFFFVGFIVKMTMN